MPQYVSPGLYLRHKEAILARTNAKQHCEAGHVVRGRSDAEIAAELGITPDEATEIRCIAELDLTPSRRWFEADAWKEERFARVQRAFAILSFLGLRWLAPRVLAFVLGALASSAVLLFGASESTFAQPRSLMLSYFCCSTVGVITSQVVPVTWLTACAALSIGVVGMRLTGSLYPPGGAMAVLHVASGVKLQKLGFGFVLVATVGAMLLVGWALLWSKLARRSYPTCWF